MANASSGTRAVRATVLKESDSDLAAGMAAAAQPQPQPQPRADLAIVKEASGAIVGGPEGYAAAGEEFGAYALRRDKFLSTDFSHNTSLARSGARFIVYEAEEETVVDKTSGELRDVFTYYVELQDPYSHIDQKTVMEKTYEKGTKLLLRMDRNGIRLKDFHILVGLINRHGGVSDLVLNEYLNKNAGQNNATGVTHHKQWRHISTVTQQAK